MHLTAKAVRRKEKFKYPLCLGVYAVKKKADKYF